jgi:CBS domain-containing protein
VKAGYDVVIVGGAVIGSAVAHYLTANPDFGGSVLVVERDRLLGIFTHGDLVGRVLAAGLDPNLTLLVEVMTADPDIIRPSDSVDEAIRLMDEYGYRHLPVVDGGRVVGMVALCDCSIEDLAAMHAELETRRVVAERAW